MYRFAQPDAAPPRNVQGPYREGQVSSLLPPQHRHCPGRGNLSALDALTSEFLVGKSSFEGECVEFRDVASCSEITYFSFKASLSASLNTGKFFFANMRFLTSY